MQRRIKSFVLRAGRMSPRQQAGFEQALTHYALPESIRPWDLTAVFGRSADTWVEIGFGMGQSLLATAIAHPEINHIGIEVHQAGLGSLAAACAEQQIPNLRIAPFDAVVAFRDCIVDNSLAGVHLFFPDPWPKKRHHKRRLLQTEFVALVAKKLQPGGYLHCATDWQAYAEHMLMVLSGNTDLVNRQPQCGFMPRPATRPMTKFEQRGLTLGNKVWDLIFEKRQIDPI